MPTDPNFQKNRKIIDRHQDHNVRGPVEPPTKLGKHGTTAAIDWNACTGDDICIKICPVDVFEWIESPKHPTSEKKSDPAREQDCIKCVACETSCPTQAMKIEQ